MGNVLVADNQEVEHTSGVSRLCSSILCAVCVAPILIIGTCVLLGWNEKRAVCDQKALTQGKNEVQLVGCSDPGSGSGNLVIFSCDLDKASFPVLTVPGSTDFSNYLLFQGTGLSITAEMYQCIESVSSQTTKDPVGGGTTTVKTYTYSKGWSSQYIDTNTFSTTGRNSDNFRQNCNTVNPQWPTGAPKSATVYASQGKVGAFTIKDEFVKNVPLPVAVPTIAPPPQWTVSGNLYSTSKWQVANSGPAAGIGQVRVSFTGTDWNQPRFTALGKNNGGVISKWTAKSSWLCSGSTVWDMQMGTISPDDEFANLKAQAVAETWILRFLGFFLLWFAFSRCVGPLEVAADCIPCIGPCLGNAVEAVGCAVACFPGCACTVGVIGVVWVAMRPAVGIPLMIIFFLVFAGLVGFKVYKQGTKTGGGGQ